MPILDVQASSATIVLLEKIAVPVPPYHARTIWKPTEITLGRGGFDVVQLQREMHTGALKAVKIMKIPSIET